MSRFRRTIPILTTVMALLACPVTAEAPARDQWGLTDRDWLTRDISDLRRGLGPDALPRIQAAAEEGDAKAAALLSDAYFSGDIPTTDGRGSVHWLFQAVAGRLPIARFMLATRYFALADQYSRDLEKAADGGYRRAKVLLAELPYAKDTQQIDLSSDRRRRLLAEAAADGDSDATVLLKALDANIRLAEDLSGQQIWKDASGPVEKPGQARASHICVTLIEAPGGPQWSLVWGALSVRPQDATGIIFQKSVYKGDPLAWEILEWAAPPDTAVPQTSLLALRRSDVGGEEARRLYARIAEDARTLDRLCRPYYAAGWLGWARDRH